MICSTNKKYLKIIKLIRRKLGKHWLLKTIGTKANVIL